MEIEILITENYCDALSGQSTCFTADEDIRKGIQHYGLATFGFVTIDGNVIPFYFSCVGMDGAIGSSNDVYRRIIKGLVPLYMFNKFKKGE